MRLLPKILGGLGITCGILLVIVSFIPPIDIPYILLGLTFIVGNALMLDRISYINRQLEEEDNE